MENQLKINYIQVDTLQLFLSLKHVAVKLKDMFLAMYIATQLIMYTQL